MTGSGLAVEDVPLERLRPWGRNPRRIRPDRLADLKLALLAEPGMLRARPLIALPDGTVIAGNQRLLAARELGWESIPVVFADLDGARAVEWALRDNRAYAEDVDEQLAVLLSELAAGGRDLVLTGFESSALDALLAGLGSPGREPDDIPALPVGEPRSRPGEVYELGSHRLMCGDATDPDQVAVLLAGEEPRLLVTDPPYGVELDMEWRDRVGLNTAGPAEKSYLRGEGYRNVSISGDTRADWSQAFELVPSLNAAYVWHASRHASLVEEGLRRIGLEVVQQIIWAKTVFILGRQHYQWQHEPCWYARRKGARVSWFGGHGQSTVWEAASPKHIMGGSSEEKIDHPTQKPVSLYTRPLENHLRRGGCFYEPFAGSGTALVAAEMTGRRCLAMELDPRYCDVIRARYEEHAN